MLIQYFAYGFRSVAVVGPLRLICPWWYYSEALEAFACFNPFVPSFFDLDSFLLEAPDDVAGVEVSCLYRDLPGGITSGQ